tara:strand:- start:4 stop:591 length:588 start_codon:yes stop_codon:yes gene_type:complete
MNHLAHLFLSQNNIDLMVGNFIADQVKGKDFNNYSEGVKQGIIMHRGIDTFTDTHPVVMQSKSRLYHIYHKYAPVIVDMYYDHILARKWLNYSTIKLSEFAQKTYDKLISQQEQMPKRSQRILHYMIQGDWLCGYATTKGMKHALGGLASRAKYDSKMEMAHLDLQKDYLFYAAEFELFFPELIEYVRNWTRTDE